MKILLDECVPKKVKKFLKEHEVKTVHEMKFNGLKDKELLEAGEGENFDILLTVDKNIDKQQNVKKYKISIVILDAIKNTVNYIEKLIPSFKKKLNFFEKGKSYKITEDE